jgi:hypothetical protein
MSKRKVQDTTTRHKRRRTQAELAFGVDSDSDDDDAQNPGDSGVIIEAPASASASSDVLPASTSQPRRRGILLPGAAFGWDTSAVPAADDVPSSAVTSAAVPAAEIDVPLVKETFGPLEKKPKRDQVRRQLAARSFIGLTRFARVPQSQ